MDKADAQLIAEAIAKQTRGGGSTDTTGSNLLNDAAKKAGESVDKARGAFDAIGPEVMKNVDMYRDLSKSGAGFNNDMVAMGVAAKGTRMTFAEFQDVVKSNSENLLGFGGSVNKGAEDFTRMSKKMFDEYGAHTDQLRSLGYNNKELNDILLMQGQISRGRFRDEKARDAAMIESATKLGAEMDAMAKLTGKSREEQLANMKKAQMDMQFEAAIRLKTQGMSAEEAKQFEDNARKQLNEAQTRGQGQMFKEIFATGTIMSKEAATQAALNQEQASATRKQAQASADAKTTAEERERRADAAGAEARRAAVADMNNTAKLQMMALGDAGGIASQALNKSAEAQINQVRGLEAIANANNLDLKNKNDLAKAQQIQAEEIKKSQEGQSGATKSVINLEQRAKDAESAIAKGLVEPINQKLNPALNKFADVVVGVNSKITGGKPFAPTIEGELREGFETPEAARRGVPQALGSAARQTTDAALRVAGQRATGGEVNDNELYVVGEQGPELFKPKSAGDIIPNKKTSSSINLSEISNTISTSLSTGGGSTTTRRVQNDESKKAEVEMESLRKKFEEDWSARKSVLIDSMAVEDRKFTKVQAAMKADETAQKLKEEFEVRRTELQKRVEDGIKWEFEKKEAAVEETKKLAQEALQSTAPTSAAANKLDIGNISFGPNGMPMFRQTQAAAATIPSKVEKEAEVAAREKQAASNETVSAEGKKESKPEAKSSAPLSRDATLSDVVAQLNQLNTKMGQLINTTESGHKDVAKAAKSNNANLFAR